jgi:hypothetical protein
MPCHVMPFHYGFRLCLSHLIYTVWPRLIHTCQAIPLPCHDILKATYQGRGRGTPWYVWTGIGCPETACGQPAQVWFLPATTQSFTKVVIRSIPIHYTVGLAFRIFPATTRTLTKDMALSENGRERHGKCELAFNAAGERHGISESALNLSSALTSTLSNRLNSFIAFLPTPWQTVRSHTNSNYNLPLLHHVSRWLSQRAVTDALTASFLKIVHTSADVSWGQS